MAKKPKHHSLVEDGGFQQYGTTKPDGKNRIVIKEPVGEYYRVYRNNAGQILLDPQVLIPAHEARLLKELRQDIAVGLEESVKGLSRPLDMAAIRTEVRKRTAPRRKA